MEISTIKCPLVGFKVTFVPNEKNYGINFYFNPSGAPNDSKIFDEVLQDIHRRKIIKRKDIILF